MIFDTRPTFAKGELYLRPELAERLISTQTAPKFLKRGGTERDWQRQSHEKSPDFRAFWD